MALTLQSIIDDVSNDIRKVLDGTAGSGDAFTLMARWVDQIHKDVLHKSIYAHHSRKVTSVTSTEGTRSYTFAAVDLRRIEVVFDTVNYRELLPWDAISSPTSSKDPKDIGPAPNVEPARQTDTIYPKFYRLSTATASGTNTHTLNLFPPPATTSQAGNIDIHYEKDVNTISASGDYLELPESARDVMVAGVNWRATQYLKLGADAAMWKQEYEALKLGERTLGA